MLHSINRIAYRLSLQALGIVCPWTTPCSEKWTKPSAMIAPVLLTIDVDDLRG
jgi:hypothetical protein